MVVTKRKRSEIKKREVIATKRKHIKYISWRPTLSFSIFVRHRTTEIEVADQQTDHLDRKRYYEPSNPPGNKGCKNRSCC